MGLIFFLLLAIMVILIRKLSKWCYRVSKVLKDNTTKETQYYVEQAIKEERERKERVKKEILSSRYLSEEYLIKERPAGSNSGIRHSIDELIKGLEKETL